MYPKFSDEYWMEEALKRADIAKEQGEIPVGAIIVRNDEIIAEGYNLSITQHDPSAHAEMMAIRAAGKVLENYRMLDCTLYVTLEPCPMCAGLMVHSRIKRLVYGASDEKTGSAGSIMDLTRHDKLNHQVEVTAGVLAERCSRVLSDFFKMRRAQIKTAKQAAKKQMS